MRNAQCPNKRQVADCRTRTTERRRAGHRGNRHRQEFWRDPGVGSGRPGCRARRDRRADGRQRRRQVDAGENPVRHARSRCGTHRGGGQACNNPLPAGRPRARHCDRPPADRPGRRAGAERRGKPDARRIVFRHRADRAFAACHPATGGRNRGCIGPRPAARPRFRRIAPGRAAAHRDRPRGCRQVVGAHSRRADLDAVCRRGRAAVRHPRKAARRGYRRALYLAPPRRSRPHRRPRRRAARRQRCRRIRKADRLPGGGRRNDRPLARGRPAAGRAGPRQAGRAVDEECPADPAGRGLRPRDQDRAKSSPSPARWVPARAGCCAVSLAWKRLPTERCSSTAGTGKAAARRSRSATASTWSPRTVG